MGLEALAGIKTVAELAREYQVHPTQVSQWKRAVVEHLPEVFEHGATAQGVWRFSLTQANFFIVHSRDHNSRSEQPRLGHPSGGGLGKPHPNQRLIFLGTMRANGWRVKFYSFHGR